MNHRSDLTVEHDWVFWQNPGKHYVQHVRMMGGITIEMRAMAVRANRFDMKPMYVIACKLEGKSMWTVEGYWSLSTANKRYIALCGRVGRWG